MVIRKRFRQGAVILLLAAILLLSWSGNPDGSFLVPGGEGVRSASDDAGIPVQTKGDLNGDGITEEYSLKDNVLTVKSGKQTLWQTPKDYRIDSFALGDVDNDGKDNLVVSLWKTGSFGEMQPFWHIGKNTDYKNHLFVYKLEDKTFKQVWCSSNLDRPILSFEIRDANDDGRNELVTKEGKYKKIAGGRYAPDPKGQTKTTVWEWEEWGFQLCDTPGMYTSEI